MSGSEAGGEWVDVRPDLRLPRFITASEGSWGPSGYEAEIVAEWDPQTLAYVVNVLRVERSGPPITAVGLRRFSVQELLRHVVRDTVRGKRAERSVVDASDLERTRLYSIAREYALARACTERPLKAVAESFGISQSYATQLVARARESGLLD